MEIMYIGFLICMFFVFTHRNDFKNWSTTEYEEKVFAMLSVLGATIFGIFSILLLIGAME